MSAPDLVELRTGTRQRVALVLAVLAGIAVLAWGLWPARSHGEPELAHRVLIVGGTPTDLVRVVAEAGFTADQRTFAETLSAIADHEPDANAAGAPSPAALLAYADEHGYGFVAVVLGDDAAWAPEVITEVPRPANAEVVVLSVGSLRGSGDPTGDPSGELAHARWGEVPSGLEFPPGLRRSESLRAALYEHPDLLALWREPSPEQMQQQVQLGKLDDARTLLTTTFARYREALDAWPDPSALPADALAPPWTSIRGLPAPGGVLVERTRHQVFVDPQRRIQVEDAATEPVFLATPVADPGGPGQAVDLPALRDGALSVDRRWLAAQRLDTGAVHRFALGPGTVEDRGEVEGGEGLSLAVASTGALAWLGRGGVETEAGDLHFGPSEVDSLAWVDADRLAVGVVTHDLDARALLPLDSPDAASPGSPGSPQDRAADSELALLVLARLPPAGESEPPAVELASLRASELITEPAGDARVTRIVPSLTACFVVVSHTGSGGGPLDTLVRAELPAELLTAATPEPETDSLATAVRTNLRPRASWPKYGDMRVDELGVLPPFEELIVAPDGSWVAWRARGNLGSIYAARVQVDETGVPRLAEATKLAEESSNDWLGQPRFSADSQTLVLGASEPWTFGRFAYLRMIPRPN